MYSEGVRDDTRLLCFFWYVTQTQLHDASGRRLEMIAVDVLAKVEIGGEQKQVFAHSPFKNGPIARASGFNTNRDDGMPSVAQPLDHHLPDILICEDPHEGVSPGASFGPVSGPPTNVCVRSRTKSVA
jgi:hypothetical protein